MVMSSTISVSQTQCSPWAGSRHAETSELPGQYYAPVLPVVGKIFQVLELRGLTLTYKETRTAAKFRLPNQGETTRDYEDYFAEQIPKLKREPPLAKLIFEDADIDILRDCVKIVGQVCPAKACLFPRGFQS